MTSYLENFEVPDKWFKHPLLRDNDGKLCIDGISRHIIITGIELKWHAMERRLENMEKRLNDPNDHLLDIHAPEIMAQSKELNADIERVREVYKIILSLPSCESLDLPGIW